MGPTTLITGLCYYFGVVSKSAYFAYFSLDDDAFGFSTADYVRDSVAVLYPVLVVLLAATCAGFWILLYGRRRLRLGRQSGRAGWAGIAAGGALIALAVWGVVAPVIPLPRGIAVPVLTAVMIPVALGLGAVLIAAGTEVLVVLRSRSSPRLTTAAERSTWLFAGAALVLALFWLTNIYANDYGRDHAEAAASELWDKESVVVLDTADPLFAPSNLLQESELSPQPGQRFRYRYECLRTVAVRPDRWVLVPARWQETYGYALIVRIDESSRVIVTRRSDLPDMNVPGGWHGEWPCPEVAPPPS
ncbi:hypothetical protein [Rhodococcus daqingensis]|uniref:Uncharacterized protein n=1 Tax=Rhodococcus daqingensis TaxID=2479363 RepID=A0ABW2RTM2_9NOCA